MEYVQMDSSIRKPPVLDTLLTTEALRVPYPMMNGGFRPMPIPNFPPSKPPTSPLTSTQPGGIGGPGDPVTAAAGLQAYIGVHFPNLVQAPRGMVGHLQVPHHLQGDFSPASLMAEGVAGSGKKTREGGARGSRGGGGSRKRTRASPPEDAAAAGTPNSAEAGVPHLIIPPGRNVSRQRTSAADRADRSEKGSCRKQTSQASKRGEKKGAQVVAALTAADTQPKVGVQNMGASALRPGLFDIYGLKTKPVDISPYLTDLSLSELVQRSTQPPVQPLKAPEVKRPDNEIPFDQQISHLLPFLPPFSKQRRSSNSPSPATRVAAGEAASAKAAAAGDSAVQPKLGGKARPHRLMFDLESPGQAQESESLTRMVDPADAEQNTQGDRDSLALHVGGAPVKEESSVDVTRKASVESGRGFVVEDLKLSSVEDFMTRLQLAPPVSLCSLIPQVSSCQGDFALPGGPSPALESNRKGSIPPQPYSHPSVGIMRSESELDRISKLGRTAQQRPWRSCVPQGFDGRQGCAVDLQELGVGNGPSLEDLETADRQLQDNARTGAAAASEQSGGLLGVAPGASPDQQDPARKSGVSVVLEIQAREGSAAVLNEDENVLAHGRTSAVTTPTGDGAQCSSEAPGQLRPGLDDQVLQKHQIKSEQGREDMGGEAQGAAVADDGRLGDANVGVTPSETAQTEEVAEPHSPGVRRAAAVLMEMSRSNESWVHPPAVVNRRRPFQSYPGAPTQKSSKSLKVGQLGGGTGSAPGHGTTESRDGLDCGNVPPNKALVSEKRKSLNQVSETSSPTAKASLPLPSRGNAWGLRGSVGSAGNRVNGWTKNVNNKVPSRAAGTIPAAAATTPAAAGPSKGANSPPSVVKGALRTKLCKGVAPPKPPTQRVGAAKSGKSSIGVMSLQPPGALPGPQVNFAKSSRHSVLPSSDRKKTKGKAGCKD